MSGFRSWIIVVTFLSIVLVGCETVPEPAPVKATAPAPMMDGFKTVFFIYNNPNCDATCIGSMPIELGETFTFYKKHASDDQCSGFDVAKCEVDDHGRLRAHIASRCDASADQSSELVTHGRTEVSSHGLTNICSFEPIRQ